MLFYIFLQSSIVWHLDLLLSTVLKVQIIWTLTQFDSDLSKRTNDIQAWSQVTGSFSPSKGGKNGENGCIYLKDLLTLCVVQIIFNFEQTFPFQVPVEYLTICHLCCVLNSRNNVAITSNNYRQGFELFLQSYNWCGCLSNVILLATSYFPHRDSF